MHIIGSAINLSAQHQAQRQETHLTLARERRIAPQRQDTVTPALTPLTPARTAQVPPLAAQHVRHHEAPVPAPISDVEDAEAAEGDSDILLLKQLVELLSGREIELYSPPGSAEATTTAQSPAAPDPGAQSQQAAVDPGQFETLLFSHHAISEYEYTSVSIQGDFLVADAAGGEQWLSIDLSVTMERKYEESQTSLTIRQGRLSDPLVLNLNGGGVELSPETTSFDLDNDGQAESIATLAGSSAYLALDANGDGQINNGSELFGPDSGNGFAELSQYDEDGNGFIDSRDSIFGELGLYRPGNDFYTPLSTSGVTAIYTGSIDSPFQLNDLQNNNLGVVRATGFFLNADYTPGVIQQIDLRV